MERLYGKDVSIGSSERKCGKVVRKGCMEMMYGKDV